MIEIRSLSLVKHKKKKPFNILKNISLTIEKGRVTLFLGKSGSGKTSILRSIAQIEKKYQGDIFCNRKRLSDLSRKERCQLIGFVPQAYALFPFMNVLENCAHPLMRVLGYSKRAAYEKVEEMVFSLEMEGLLHSYPHELSGGQQQRTSILRALMLDPQFLMLDEPTSALDPENTNLLIQIIRRLKNGGTGVIISSQDILFSQKICEEAIFLEHGAIVERYDQNHMDRNSLLDTKLGHFLYSKNTLGDLVSREGALCSKCKMDISTPLQEI